jgi:Flp pilus assembly pilin Flp
MEDVTNMNHPVLCALRALWRNKAGQDLIEYALLAGFVASLAVAVFPAIGATSVLFSRAMTALALALSATAAN